MTASNKRMANDRKMFTQVQEQTKMDTDIRYTIKNKSFFKNDKRQVNQSNKALKTPDRKTD